MFWAVHHELCCAPRSLTAIRRGSLRGNPSTVFHTWGESPAPWERATWPILDMHCPTTTFCWSKSVRSGTRGILCVDAARAGCLYIGPCPVHHCGTAATPSVCPTWTPHTEQCYIAVCDSRATLALKQLLCLTLRSMMTPSSCVFSQSPCCTISPQLCLP